MQPETNQTSPYPSKNHSIVPVILAVILTALVSGGLVYWWLIPDQELLNQTVDSVNNLMDPNDNAQLVASDNVGDDLEQHVPFVAMEPTWLTYSDQDIIFLYPKSFCSTSWQADWDTGFCDEDWQVERTQTVYSSSDYAGGAEDPEGAFIQIYPPYSSFGFEFGGDFQIEFISKDNFQENIIGKTQIQINTRPGYVIYVAGGAEAQSNETGEFYLTNGTKFIRINDNFPDRYPEYLSFLVGSVELK